MFHQKCDPLVTFLSDVMKDVAQITFKVEEKHHVGWIDLELLRGAMQGHHLGLVRLCQRAEGAREGQPLNPLLGTHCE